jgi:hypothetical protein
MSEPGFDPGLTDAERAEKIRRGRAQLAVLPPDRYPCLVAGATAMTAYDPEFHLPVRDRPVYRRRGGRGRDWLTLVPAGVGLVPHAEVVVIQPACSLGKLSALVAERWCIPSGRCGAWRAGTAAWSRATASGSAQRRSGTS